MPPFVIPPLVKLALGAAATGVVMTWAVREFRRLKEEIERAKTAKIPEPVRKESLPTLRRDPATGDYRVM